MVNPVLHQLMLQMLHLLMVVLQTLMFMLFFQGVIDLSNNFFNPFIFSGRDDKHGDEHFITIW
jgi:hypothetical protein